jgi:DNA-binding NarL/FixJ family response regulator
MKGNRMAVRILVADDHCIVRQGLCNLIEGHTGYAVAGQAGSGWEAVRFTRRLCPEIVIMDIGMPDLNGIDATRMCIEVCPRIKVIALSMHADRRYVLGMLKAGARGYILKESAFEDLIRAIDAACNHEIYLSPKVAGTVVEDAIRCRVPEPSSPFDALTVREREVLQMVAEGRTTRRMAAMLNVSIKTVEARRKSIMRKLDLHSIAELTKYAVREGLTSVEN